MPSKDRVYKRQGTIWIPWSTSLSGRKRTRASRRMYKRSSKEENLKPDDCLPTSIIIVGRDRIQIMAIGKTVKNRVIDKRSKQKEKNKRKYGANMGGQSEP